MFKEFFKLQSELFGAAGMPTSVTYNVLLKGTLISLLRNPITSLFKGLSMIRNRGEMIAKPVLKLLPEITDESRSGQEIEKVLDEMGLPQPLPGSLKLLIDGEAFFPDLEEKIEAAGSSVDVRVFIFDNDDCAVSVADLLKQRSGEVKCRVLLDHLGSITSWFNNRDDDEIEKEKRPSSIVEYLKEDSQVIVRRSLNPFFVADHSKLFVIDEKIAYLGGMNIGHEYRHDWHDMMVRIEGPIVAALQEEYDRAYGLQGSWGDWTSKWRKRKKQSKISAEPGEGEIRMRILKTLPFKNQIESAAVAAIQLCESRLYLQNAYFTSDVILDEMLEARKRGVDVRMIFPADNDSKLLEANNNSVTRKLLDGDIRVYRYPIFSHIKAMVADGWAMLGSANLDTLSLRINEELNVAFSDTEAVEELVRELFEADFEASEEITESDAEPVTGSLIEALADQL